jgi:hypothetical protein
MLPASESRAADLDAPGGFLNRGWRVKTTAGVRAAGGCRAERRGKTFNRFAPALDPAGGDHRVIEPATASRPVPGGVLFS